MSVAQIALGGRTPCRMSGPGGVCDNRGLKRNAARCVLDLVYSMLLLPWYQTVALLSAGSGVVLASSFYVSPLGMHFSQDVIWVLAPLMAAAYLPSFVVLPRGVSGALIDRQMVTETLERRLRYEQALAACSAALLASSTETSLSGSLELLLEASEVDAIVVARNVVDDRGELARDILSVVKRSSSAPYVLADNDFQWADTPSIRDHLQAGKTYFYLPGTVPPEEARVFEEAGIMSDLVIPIGVDGEWAGYISFTDCSGRAEWHSYDLELLPSVARMIGAHWTRLDNADRLRRMIEAKDEFIASVSHELRTPLTAVVGFAAELRDGFEAMAEKESRELIDLISEQSLEVAHIVEDLLVVARLGGDSLTLVNEEVSALTETDQVVRSLGMVDSVRYTGEPHNYAIADSGRYRQIVRNLLTNARRYGGSDVVVDSSYTEDEAIIRIRDNGPGVPEDEWERIFEPYARTEPEGSTPGSVGLGLTVSRQLARLMGGDLGYGYRDGWSEFELRLPISAKARHPLTEIRV